MEGQFRSLIDIFKTGKEQYPDKTAIIMGEDTRTYGDIFDNAKKIAGFVLKKGIKPQDKVAVISQNHVDYNFIRAACRKMKLEMRLETASRDTLALSRRKIKGVGSYQLEALMKHLGYEVSNAHRALADCYFTWQLYQKLNEM